MSRTTTKLSVTLGAAAFGLALAGAWTSSLPGVHADTTAPSIPLTGNWTIDPAHTNVNFGIRHFGISQVRGRFDDVAGTIVADAEHPEKSSVSVTIQTAGINTNVKMRDDDLRSANYFDAAKYPQITFQSTKIEKGKNGGFIADGDLTIHGVTKTVALPFHVSGPIKDPFGGTRFGLETEVHINRLDYGVGNGQTIADGDFAEGKDVDVVISVEAVPAKTP
jgi:polyisoprenoid-binding protein YceI